MGSRELESMSDIEVASFHRGGPSRASMPAVRVATSLSDVSLGEFFYPVSLYFYPLFNSIDCWLIDCNFLFVV